MARASRLRWSIGTASALTAALLVISGVSAAPIGAARSQSVITTQTIQVGPLNLTGTLTLPAGEGPAPVVILVAGSGPDNQDETVGQDAPFLDLAKGLAADGIASIRYDKRTLDDPATIDVAAFTPKDEYVTDAVAAVRLGATRRVSIPTGSSSSATAKAGSWRPRSPRYPLGLRASSWRLRRSNPFKMPCFVRSPTSWTSATSKAPRQGLS